jgi:hypothetical protein
MPGKRVQFDDATWHALDQLAKDRMQDAPVGSPRIVTRMAVRAVAPGTVGIIVLIEPYPRLSGRLRGKGQVRLIYLDVADARSIGNCGLSLDGALPVCACRRVGHPRARLTSPMGGPARMRPAVLTSAGLAGAVEAMDDQCCLPDKARPHREWY